MTSQEYAASIRPDSFIETFPGNMENAYSIDQVESAFLDGAQSRWVKVEDGKPDIKRDHNATHASIDVLCTNGISCWVGYYDYDVERWENYEGMGIRVMPTLYQFIVLPSKPII